MSLSRLLRLSAAVSPSSAVGRLGFSSSAAAAAAATRAPSNRDFTSPSNLSGNELYRRISPAGDHRVSIVPILDQWVEEGKPVEKHQLVSFIKELRHYHRNSHALEISKWMTEKRCYELTSRDAATRMDLIARVQGIKPAVEFFETLPQQLKGINTYGALLNCYCRIRDVEKAESVMQSMKELGISKVTLSYNGMLSLYHRVGDTDKFENLLKEMNDDGISYDVITYNILISAYGAREDLEGMKKTLLRMESDPGVDPDWMVYTTVATNYRKAGMVEEAVKMLEKSEGLIGKKKKDVIAYNYLLTSYAAIGDKDRVLAVWERLKKHGKVLNKGYADVISSLSKLGDLETAQKIFDEWETQNKPYDVRIPNVLVGAYAKSGRLEEAEAIVERVRSKGAELHANSWLSLASGYLDRDETLKAVEAMRRALSDSKSGWKPDPRGLAECLERLKGKGDCLDEAKELMELLTERIVVPSSVRDKWLASADGGGDSSDQVNEPS